MSCDLYQKLYKILSAKKHVYTMTELQTCTYVLSVSGGGRSPIVVSVRVDQYKDLRYFLATEAYTPLGSG
jgi:hypothetical protein